MGVANYAERLVYRAAGLPVALSHRRGGKGQDPLRTAFAWRYWRPQGVAEWAELIGGFVAWPIVLVGGILWYTARNGAIVRRRSAKPILAQAAEQLGLHFSTGLLAPWYYIFSLYEGDGARRAGTYIQRFETKPSLFLLLKGRKGSPLNDKIRFAEYCRSHGIRCAATIFELDGRAPAERLPDCDLFVKPSKGRGGKGAERWDLVAPGCFASPTGEQLDADALLARLVEESARTPLVVQPRLTAHPELADLTTGALPTVRMVTCLDEQGEPELIGGVFRMSVGRNVTVDNLHAGGIAAAVSSDSGTLSKATNLGADARLGWLTAHPDTAAPIAGRVLPLWSEAKRLAIAAHRAFTDRVVIGWDIAILADGPVLIEGNGNSDLDILQRFMTEGLRRGRLAELMVHHLRGRVPALAERLCASGDAALDQQHEAGGHRPHQRQADAGSAGLGAQLPQE